MKKELLVKDVYSLHGTSSVAVARDASMETIVRIYGGQPHVRGVFLVDGQHRFVGLVSRLAIKKWAEFQLFGKWQGDGSCEGVDGIIRAAPARNLAHGDWASFGLKTTNSLEEAFQRMLSLDEDILPVVDDAGRVIGDLSLSEIMVKALDRDCPEPT